MTGHISYRFILISAVVCAALYATLAMLGDLRRQITLFLGVAGGLWGLYAYCVQRLSGVFLPSLAGESSGDLSRRELELQAAMILIFAFLFRGLMLPTAPWLSDDIYRYLWDGRVLLHGFNPYDWPPEAPALAALRDTAVFPHVNHPHIGTIYPPLLQILFALGQFIGGTVLSMKAIFVFCDALVLMILMMVLRRTGRDPRWVLIYAWNPLPILEISGSGHADVVVGLLLLIAAMQLGAGNFRGAAAVIGAGFLSKFASVLVLPFVWMRRHIRDSVWIFLTVVALGYLPFCSAGGNLFAGLLTFSAKWRFNDSIFSLIYWPIEKLLPDSLVIAWMTGPDWVITAQTLLTRRIDLALLISKAIVAGIFLAWMAWLWRFFTREENSFEGWGRLSVLLYAGLLLLSPTFQPWYMLWVMPLLALWPNRGLLLLSGAVFLSYWILQDYARTGVWQENALIKWLEFTPVFAVMIYDAFARKGRVVN